MNSLNQSMATPKLGVFETYSTRLSRRAILHHFCNENHPVLLLELSILESARIEAQNFVISTIIPSGKLETIKPMLIKYMREIAVRRVLADSDIDCEVREILFEQIGEWSFDELFPSIN